MKKILSLFIVLGLISCEEDVPSLEGELDFFAESTISELNPVDVSKGNKLPVYMHYMPWFETPNDTTDNWGYHWTMSNADPFEIDNATGQREIASHYYPLIGPYHSADPDVIRYHLLLMKYSGVDGILIDWYGVQGSNPDIEMLLNNSNRIISHLDEVGLGFAVVLEDRFAESASDVAANLQYLENNYYNHSRYLKRDEDPYLLIFGPIGIGESSDWTNIVSATSANEVLLPLWNNGATGTNASGSYAWPVQGGVSSVESYYVGSSVDDVIGGVVYPGFEDYYLEGTGEDIIGWELPVSTETFQNTLDAALDNLTTIDFLQVATWNDFGEGTIVEPTVENEFQFLTQLQEFTFINRFTENDLRLIYQWYEYTKDESLDEDPDAQSMIQQAFYHLVALEVDQARDVINQLGE